MVQLDLVGDLIFRVEYVEAVDFRCHARVI